jgi:hypothetical protein
VLSGPSKAADRETVEAGALKRPGLQTTCVPQVEGVEVAGDEVPVPDVFAFPLTATRTSPAEAGASS